MSSPPHPSDDARRDASGQQPTGLSIPVRAGIGSGPTKLAAFDAALQDAGVADRNLIQLSSVIPPGSVVTRAESRLTAPGEWGDRLYVVMAQARTAQLGDRLAAGIGWAQDEATGRGLFVEHEGHSIDEVETHIRDSLEALTSKRGMDLGTVQMELSSTVCEAPAACALVVAVFEAESWSVGPVRPGP